MVGIIYVVYNVVGNHAQDWNWSPETMNKIRVSTRVSKPFQKHAESFRSSENRSLIALH